ncbi:MAG TPA: hypothetical protein VFF79_12890 [Conexibacter sp.]|nr:hypothetical protein [Conexibacter sp.]
MLQPHAIHRFQQAQRELIHNTYLQAWQAGVDGYEPDQDPTEPLPDQDHHPAVVAAVGAGAAAALLARRHRRYKPPTEPDQNSYGRATRPALRSIDKMGPELASLTPSQQHLDTAQRAVDAGELAAASIGVYALGLALQDWIDSNSYRLNLGESVAWAGEQDGYAQAAATDGMLLQWQTEDDERVCDDCLDLGNLPPMVADDWPTTPGAGGTICEQGCRCSLEATSDLNEGDQLYVLNAGENALVGSIAAKIAA